MVENKSIDIENIFRSRLVRGMRRQRIDPVEEAIEYLRQKLPSEAFEIAANLPVSEKLYLHTLWEHAENKKRLETKPANRGGL